MFVKVSLRDWLALQILLKWLCLPAFLCLWVPSISKQLPPPNCFLKVCLPMLRAAVLKFYLPLTTSAISGAAFPTQSTHNFCGWGDIFTLKGNCGFPNTLYECTESTSTMPTNTSIEWNLYLSWSNHLVTSFRLEMNVGGFSEHQNKTSDTDRYKGHFFTLVSLKSMWILWKEFFSSGLNCRLLNVW